MLRTFKDLKVWQKSYDLCKQVYGVSTKFPREERFGLTAQLRRAAVSIPSNIAEGYTRGTTKEYLRFLGIASGSLGELETQLLLCRDLELCNEARVVTLLDSVAEVERMLAALIRSLKERQSSSTAP